MTDNPRTDTAERVVSPLEALLRTPCDCSDDYTLRGRHAPDCRYQFIHDYLDDSEIAAVLDAARSGDGLREALADMIDTVAFLSSVVMSGETLDEHDGKRIGTAMNKARAALNTSDTGARTGGTAYNDPAGTSSESNSIADPARPFASPKSGGSVDSRRD